MIRESRPWMADGWKYLLVLPLAIVLMTGRTRVEVSEAGFDLQPGPLPAGVRRERHGRDAIKQAFPRHLRAFTQRPSCNSTAA